MTTCHPPGRAMWRRRRIGLLRRRRIGRRGRIARRPAAARRRARYRDWHWRRLTMRREAAAAAALGCPTVRAPQEPVGCSCRCAGYCWPGSCGGYCCCAGYCCCCGYCTGGGCAGKPPLGTSAGGRGGESLKGLPNWAATGAAASVAPITTMSAAIRAMNSMRGLVGGVCPPRPVNMPNKAKPGIRISGIRSASTLGIAGLTSRPDSTLCSRRSPWGGGPAPASIRSADARPAYR